MKRSNRRIIAAWVALPLAVALAACSAPGSGSGGGSQKSTEPTSVSKDVAKAGKVTLREWDQEVRGGQNAEMTRLNKEFMKKYPNVTIKRTSKSFSDLKTTLKLSLSGNNPPDVVEVNQGYPDMVSFVRANMLMNLDKYAAAYNWKSRYSPALLDLNRVNDSATKFGTGHLYGVSQMGEFIGIYYNQKKLKSLGIKPPKNWSQFERSLAKIKKSGQLPIQFGNLDKYPAIHTIGLIQAQNQPPKKIRSLVYGGGDTKWTSPGFEKSAKTLQQWTKKGYFPSGPNGIGYDDAAKQFSHGQGAYLITGTWEAADIKKPMGNSLRMMLPPAPAGQQHATTGGESLALSITQKSKHPNVAAAYINFLTNKHAAKVMADTGNLPAVPGATSPKSKYAVDKDMFRDWKTINSVDGLVPYLDYSSPTFYDTITAALQELIGGSLSPKQFATKLQSDVDKFHSQQ